MMFQPFSDEQARVVVNLAQAYDVWMGTLRTLAGSGFGSG